MDLNIDNSILVQIDQLKSYVTYTSPDQWKKLGISFFKRAQYDLSIKCFKTCGDKDLLFRAEAAMIASKASEKLRMINEMPKDSISAPKDKMILEMKLEYSKAA